MLFLCLLAYPKKQSSPVPVCISVAVGPLVSSLCSRFYHSKSLPLHTELCVSLILPGPYLPLLVKLWWLHRKIHRSKANQPESPEELEKLQSQPNQPKKCCRQVKKSSDRASPDTLQTQCKVYGHGSTELQINIVTACPYITSFHFS